MPRIDNRSDRLKKAQTSRNTGNRPNTQIDPVPNRTAIGDKPFFKEVSSRTGVQESPKVTTPARTTITGSGLFGEAARQKQLDILAKNKATRERNDAAREARNKASLDTGIDQNTQNEIDRLKAEIGLGAFKGDFQAGDKAAELLNQFEGLQGPQRQKIQDEITNALIAEDARQSDRGVRLREQALKESASSRSELARQTAAETRQQSLAAAGRGTARGSREFERALIREDIQNQRRQSIEASNQIRTQFLIEQAEGADDARLQALGQRLDASNAQRMELDRQLAEEELGITKEQRGFERQKEFAQFTADINQLPTFQQKQDAVLQQVSLGGQEFIDSLGEEGLAKLEKDAGYSPGFLKAALPQLIANGDSNNEFTFTAPKVDDFGNLITPGYVFNKGTGSFSTIDPTTGKQTIIPGGSGAMNTFKGFEDYSLKTGNGNVISGSPYHKGFEVDIDGDIDDPILAYTGGEVVEAALSEDGFGNTVVVEMPDGNRIRYAHLNSVGVKEGQILGAGSFIGGMGNTGSTIPMGGGDGSHLHMEARDKQGKLVPLNQLKAFVTLQEGVSDTNLLRAEASSKGYLSKQEQQSYIAAKRAGIALPDRVNELLPNEKLKTSLDLGKEFQVETKAIQTTIINIDKLNNSLDLLNQDIADGKGFKKLNAVSQAIIIGFNKMLDPGSVVRESEYNRVGEGQSVSDRMRGTLQNWVEGGASITPENLQEFVNVANSWAGTYENNFRDKGQRFQYIADRAGLDQNIIFTPNALELINSLGNEGELIDAGASFYSGGGLPPISQSDQATWDSIPK